MTQCYAEIAQKQREIADYNAKIQKLNSEISELNQVKSRISSLQGSFSECKNSGTSRLGNTGDIQKINSKFMLISAIAIIVMAICAMVLFYDIMIYIMAHLFRMFSVGLIRQLSVLCWKLQRNKMK